MQALTTQALTKAEISTVAIRKFVHINLAWSLVCSRYFEFLWISSWIADLSRVEYCNSSSLMIGSIIEFWKKISTSHNSS